MMTFLRNACFAVAAASFLPQAATANDQLLKMQEDPELYVMQTLDYANTRYSKLDQINKDNVGDLQVAWTFSTGVLRGHEGAPLVINDTMYVHTPFPNNVYALDLNADGRLTAALLTPTTRSFCIKPTRQWWPWMQPPAK